MRLLGFTLLLLAAPLAAHAAEPRAVALIHQALAAQGGEDRLRALKAVRTEMVGYRNLLEQSERPDGPYIPEFINTVEVRDFERDRFLETQTTAVYPNGDGSDGGTSTTVVSDGVAMRKFGEAAVPGDRLLVRLAKERLALSPERLLLTALTAADLRMGTPVAMQGMTQDVLCFTHDGAPVRLILNPHTHLPTAFDYSGPLARTGFFAYTGDAVRRTYYSLWTLTAGGVRLPMQTDLVVNGLPDRTFTVSKLTVDPTPDDAAFAIPETVRTAFKPEAPPRDLETLPLGRPGQAAQMLAPGVALVSGGWNVTMVAQEDGVVVLDAPISSGYSAKVMGEAKRLFPGKRVKAVITTSDAWPHIAGLREYVAAGVPIYALDLNRPAILRVLNAPHTASPDRLQRAPRAPRYHFVETSAVIGSGDNRLEIYPLHNETSERQMMVYLPGRHLLYGSDVFQVNQQGGFTYPEQVLELAQAVKRHGLQVDQLVMMHLGPISWSKATASLPSP